MKKPDQTTFLDPSYRRTSSGHRQIDGVQFDSYSVGILTYARISEDGRIMVWTVNAHRSGEPTYFAKVAGHGFIKGRGGSTKRFRSEEAACRAGVKLLRGAKC